MKNRTPPQIVSDFNERFKVDIGYSADSFNLFTRRSEKDPFHYCGLLYMQVDDDAEILYQCTLDCTNEMFNAVYGRPIVQGITHNGDFSKVNEDIAIPDERTLYLESRSRGEILMHLLDMEFQPGNQSLGGTDENGACNARFQPDTLAWENPITRRWREYDDPFDRESM